MKYFKVTARCGHVRRRHYVLKDFYVEAENKKDAVHKTRRLQIVQYDKKDAIRDVNEITLREYLEGLKITFDKLYLLISNFGFGRNICPLSTMTRYEETTNISVKKKRDHQKRAVLQRIYEREWEKERHYYYGE